MSSSIVLLSKSFCHVSLQTSDRPSALYHVFFQSNVFLMHILHKQWHFKALRRLIRGQNLERDSYVSSDVRGAFTDYSTVWRSVYRVSTCFHQYISITLTLRLLDNLPMQIEMWIGSADSLKLNNPKEEFAHKLISIYFILLYFYYSQFIF